MEEQKVNPKPSPVEKNVFLIVNRQMIPIEKAVIRLGRQLENDVVFHEEFVSRFHAEIRIEEGKYVLYDTGSTGGTFVNGRKIDRCVLNSGDLISITSVQIMFVNNNAGLVGKSRGTTQSLRRDI